MGTGIDTIDRVDGHDAVITAVSQAGPDDVALRAVMDLDRFMWGSGYSHDGTSRILAETAARLYAFDLAALAPPAAKFGPTVEELAPSLAELPAEPNEALRRGAGRGLR